MTHGDDLIGRCKHHLLETMRGMPECSPGGAGAGSRLIEEAADFDLGLRGQNGWLTWSLLISMVEEGDLEVAPGTEHRRKYRLR
jgi:hypothetical protein